MAELAIKGHLTRGKEVIEILEMLGGKNLNNLDGASNMYYFIGLIVPKILAVGKLELDKSHEQFTYFTLEEFLEKYPYKVGDEVEYKSIGDANLKSKIIYMEWCNALNKVLYTTEDAHVISTEDITETKSFPTYMDYDIKEEIMEKNQPPKTQEEVDKYLKEHPIKNAMNVIDIETCLEMDGLNLSENVVINSKGIGSIQFIQWYEKQQYPKTYDECCTYLGLQHCGLTIDLPLNYSPLFISLAQLYICRNAYWKIAGDWEEKRKERTIHYLTYSTLLGEVVKDSMPNCIANYLLDFPTEEMRDEFYNNFKDLIEQCKELL